MKVKKLAALLLAGAMTFSMAACGSDGDGGNSGNSGSTTNTPSNDADAGSSDAGSADAGSSDAGTDAGTSEGGSLVVWTLADDLKQFAERYKEQTGVDVTVEVYAPADYPTKLTSALGAKSNEVDIIVGEPQMLGNFFEAGFFADLSSLEADAKEQIVDYVYEAGKDDSGVLRALSYQVTPGAIIYRRDLAQTIFGTDDPDEMSKKFKDYDTILQTAQEVKDAGYRIFSDSGNLRWYANAGAAWVVDGVLQVSDAKLGYMDAAVKLYQDELVAFAPEWSAAWYASMGGPLPLNAGWSDLAELSDADMTEIFAYSLPSWGALIVRDNANDLKGNFGICSGPCSYFGGGTFIGVNAYSKNQELAADFVRFCTLNEETAQWWLETSNGDVVSNKAVLEANQDYENESFGNQKTYEFYLKEAQNIDYSVVTKYDDSIGNFWGSSIEAIQKGEMTKEEAIEDFYMQVEVTFPEITVNR
ncbi:MAG: ABC transporter substrate-binding protein [Lachnospiraceae bacterium]|nr:ABC transporter substrate-binding protein [Lachnospiraceae bacterium]